MKTITGWKGVFPLKACFAAFLLPVKLEGFLLGLLPVSCPASSSWRVLFVVSHMENKMI